jgi:hypothetical protein
MDLSENGKCLFTSMQYVESSHAPYQRIRFFLFSIRSFRHNMNFLLLETWPQTGGGNLLFCWA